ncbi:MAG: hypothetical protein EBZ87_00130 [Microbacteriaceae bacterium]|nr:hypothetical protein [Microbacteriaceae bacterium]
MGINISPEEMAGANATFLRQKAEAERAWAERLARLQPKPEGALRERPLSPIIIREAADLTDEMLPAISDLTDDLCPDPDERVDWEQFVDYLERWENIVVADLDCPAFRKLQRIVRRLREQE